MRFEHSSNTSTRKLTSRPLVLCIDDDDLLLQGLKRQIGSEDFDLITSNSPFKAIETMAEIQVDVLVADQKMPGLSGTELLDIARQRHPHTVRLMLTGEATLQTALHAINQGGVFRFLEKPCNPTELKFAINQALSHRKALSAASRLIDVLGMQSKYIEHLEREHPGISSVKRDSEGAIIIESSENLSTVLQNIQNLIEDETKE